MKRLVRGLNQPMTARLIKTARSLKTPQENDGFFSLQHFRVGSLARTEDFIGQMLSHDLSRENYQRCKGEERTEDSDARKMEQFVYIQILICSGKAFKSFFKRPKFGAFCTKIGTFWKK